jgi:MFS family permease
MTNSDTGDGRRGGTRAVVASTVGAGLEWFDFTLFSLASALVLGQVFFPSENATTSTLAAFATFGVGFIARPFGGALFGHLGDRLGRRAVLFATVLLMSVATTLIGLLPGYATLGVAAPVLLVVLRLLQGLGAGAELAGATLFAAEHSSDRRRGLSSAMPNIGTPLGVFAASLCMTTLSQLPGDQFVQWGWRVPFIASILIGGFAVWIRQGVAESPSFRRQPGTDPASTARSGFVALLRRHPRATAKAFLISIGPNASVYITTVFAVSYLTGQVGAPSSYATNAVTYSTLISLAVVLVAGLLSDSIGRRPVFIVGCLVAAASAFPFFALLDTGDPWLITIAFVLMYGIAAKTQLAAQGAILPEQFPAEVRFSGVAAARETSSALVGGTIPFVATAIVAMTGGTTMVSILVIVISLAAAAGGFLVSDRRGGPIDDTPEAAKDVVSSRRP